jgi:hypothetical protein
VTDKKFKRKCEYKFSEIESRKLDLANKQPGAYGRPWKHADSIYVQNKNNKNVVEESDWRGHKCRRNIEIGRGEAPFCDEHKTNQVISEWKEQKRLKAIYKKKQYPKRSNANYELSDNSDYWIGKLIMFLLFLPAILIPALVFIFFDAEYSSTDYNTVGNYNRSRGLYQSLESTGSSIKAMLYPNLFKSLLSIALVFPIYNLILDDENSWPIKIFKALALLVLGLPVVIGLYGIIGFFLGIAYSGY